MPSPSSLCLTFTDTGPHALRALGMRPLHSTPDLLVTPEHPLGVLVAVLVRATGRQVELHAPRLEMIIGGRRLTLALKPEGFGLRLTLRLRQIARMLPLLPVHFALTGALTERLTLIEGDIYDERTYPGIKARRLQLACAASPLPNLARGHARGPRNPRARPSDGPILDRRL